MQDYADIQDAVEQLLQDTSNATYDTTELGVAIEASLQEFSGYMPHILPVIFKIESRTGIDTAGTASSLTDTTNSQFLAADATDEKVVHNIKDDTWAVVLTRTSASVMTLSADIMDLGESYEIYDKRCWNKKQIYIGDFTNYIVPAPRIDSVEYPVGTKRNWKVYDEVLEIDVSYVDDSDSTKTTLPRVDVLVRFAVPHVLSQLASWTWELTGDELVNATDVDIDIASHAAGSIKVGEEFHVENHRSVYKVNADATITTNGRETATIFFYPPLEAAASNNDTIVFRKSTLQPQHEQLLIRLIAARAQLSESTRHQNTIAKGGSGTWRDIYTQARAELEDVRAEITGIARPRTSRTYTRGR